MRIDWVRKLTSRKFWLAIIGFITPLMIAFGADESAVTQASAIVIAGGTLIAYIIGEGLVDAAGTDAPEQADQPKGNKATPGDGEEKNGEGQSDGGDI